MCVCRCVGPHVVNYLHVSRTHERTFTFRNETHGETMHTGNLTPPTLNNNTFTFTEPRTPSRSHSSQSQICSREPAATRTTPNPKHCTIQCGALMGLFCHGLRTNNTVRVCVTVFCVFLFSVFVWYGRRFLERVVVATPLSLTCTPSNATRVALRSPNPVRCDALRGVAVRCDSAGAPSERVSAQPKRQPYAHIERQAIYIYTIAKTH